MAHLPDEFRLAIVIAVNVFVFVAAFRSVRRFTGQDRIGAGLDALLIHYLVQYMSVCVPGVLGILSAETMLFCATALGAGMLWFDRRAGFSSHVPLVDASTCGLKPARRLDSLVLSACLLFVFGYFIALIRALSTTPLIGDDALTYHLPVVGQWLQADHLGLYTTWFFNPANTYSPLAGSTFFTWLIAPIGADVMAQFAQMPAMIVMFLAIVQIARSLGVRVSVASIAATGAMLSRPFISESIIIKDDHFLAAFFLVAVAGCTTERLKDRLGPWRIGVALGLFFATKYTALLTAPLLLLLIDAPIRAGWKWKNCLTFVACAITLASPWYIRNWVVTGNPIYPVPISIGSFQIFQGMFIPERSTEMRTIDGAWKTLTHGYNSLSRELMSTLILVWLGAIVSSAKQIAREPLIRVALIGVALGLAIFFFASHAALIRYAYPSLLLLFICVAIFAGRLPIPFIAQVIVLALITALSMYGGFESKDLLGSFLVTATIVTVIGMLIITYGVPALRNSRVRLITSGIGTFIGICAVYIYWHAFLIALRQNGFTNLTGAYKDQVPMWAHIQEKVPADAPIAYTNLVFTRPLMGFDYSRRVFYIPVRPGVHQYHDLPASRDRVTDQEIRAYVAKLLNDPSDQKLWRDNLLKSDAQYLLVGRQSILANPVEMDFAKADPIHFMPEYENESGILYKVRR